MRYRSRKVGLDGIPTMHRVRKERQEVEGYKRLELLEPISHMTTGLHRYRLRTDSHTIMLVSVHERAHVTSVVSPRCRRTSADSLLTRYNHLRSRKEP
jgi:hypothetical protein